MAMPRVRTLYLAAGAAFFLSLTGSTPLANASVHLWHVKEVFTNASGTVQFVEMFNSFGGENFTDGYTLRANSDGVIKDFVFPDNIGGDTTGMHMLIATTGFGSLPGAVAPDFTFDQSTTPFSGQFINPNATNISITFFGSFDSMSFTGAALPKNGINSLTDSGAVNSPPGTPNISSGINSPTNSTGAFGSVNLSTPSPTGDYNGNHVVDAGDYIVWRKTLTNPADPEGSGADGDSSGAIGPGDYTFWRARFGNPAPGSGSLVGVTAPEPTSLAFAFLAFTLLALRRSTFRAKKC